MPKSASPKLDGLLHLLYALSALSVLLITTFNLYLYTNRKTEVIAIKTSPIEERSYWENLAKKSPSYRDAWLQIAKIDSEIGDYSSANKALEKAKAIDPNSVVIMSLEKQLARR